MPPSFPPLLVARQAMATRFEFVLHGERPTALRAAAEEALDEVERIENLLSLYRPQTDIARINAAAGRDAVRVSLETFRLLERVRGVSQRTNGAFDPTAGPLVRVWGFHGSGGGIPDPARLAAAQRSVGWDRVILDAGQGTVRLEVEFGMLDLGAVGKGYALDRAAEVLREAGVESALLHGGTSTVVALGRPPESEGWRVALPVGPQGCVGETIVLRDESLSVSAVWGRSFEDDRGQLRGHVIDPRSGEPVSATRMAAVVAPLAEESDALSTALLVLGRDGRRLLENSFSGLRIWIDASGSAGDPGEEI